MTLFTTEFRAEANKGVGAAGHPEIYPMLQLALPSGTRRFSSVGLASAGRGYGEPLIEQWGSISRSVDLRGANLQSIEVSPVLLDPDRTFANEVARYRRSLRRSAASIWLVSPNVPDVQRFVAFSGILDGWDESRPLAWTLRLRPDDTVLQFGQIPKATITPVDWPQADPSAYGNYMPIIYGIHSSDGVGNNGMVPTYYVDTVNFYYLLSLGTIKTIRSVYADGTLVSTANWTRGDDTVNGKRVTFINFTSDQGTAVITADVEGLTSDASGSGAVLTDSVEQLRHALHNFVWADWRNNAYETATAPLLSASFDSASAFLLAMGHEGSKWIGGSQSMRALDFLEEWAESHDLRPYWTNAGQLALGVNDHRTLTVYPSTWLQADIDEHDMSVPFDTQNLVQEVTLQFVYGQAAEKYHQTATVQDLSVSDPVVRQRNLPWSAARVI